MKTLLTSAAAIFVFASTFTSCNKNDGLIQSANNQVGLSETYDEVQNGLWLLMTYDATSDSFVGTVENATTKSMKNVQLEIQLSNGHEIGRTNSIDLAAGEMKAVRISANGEDFEEWMPRALRD